jgi:hypothetical protein
MNIADYVSKKDVQLVCQELGIRDWTRLEDTKVELEEARIIQAEVGSEALQIPVKWFQQGLEVELEHGLQFPDANVTNNQKLSWLTLKKCWTITSGSMLLNLREICSKQLKVEILKNWPGSTRS